ncbi:threonine dehydratase [Acidicapsa dinghuensis]|uniref:Threonine dehydratase n=1 Tax=Acidicapsa dinghuensis TaxID=2218256 RepID=A0ABW1ENS1_9BACT|nr:threonine dehydratase [Acidicapsa dinghuensis]
MQLPTLPEIEAAQSIVYRAMPPTPQYSWPLLNQRLSAGASGNGPIEAWIKHENHSPVGAFKIRGALVYAAWLRENHPNLTTVVAATRGNHGQGVAFAAHNYGLRTVIVVPHGNSKEKNLAMQAQGAELIEHGSDFQASLEFARDLASSPANSGTHAFVESFHPRLVMGTATYALEFFRGVPPLDIIYVPIGLGSSICGVSAVRNALGLKTEIVGVVASQSPSYALSFAQHQIVEAPSRTQIADGLACRIPNRLAMEIIWDNVARIIEVSDEEIAHAMRACYHDTHNLAEGAAAAALAGALREGVQSAGKRIGIVLTGANIDSDLFTSILGSSL